MNQESLNNTPVPYENDQAAQASDGQKPLAHVHEQLDRFRAPTIETLRHALSWLEQSEQDWVREDYTDLIRKVISAKVLIQRYVDWHSPLPDETVLQFDAPQLPDGNGACVQCDREGSKGGWQIATHNCEICGHPLDGDDYAVCVQCEGALTLGGLSDE